MTFAGWWEKYTKDSTTSFEVFRPAFHKCYRDAQAAIAEHDSRLPAKNERLEIAVKKLAHQKKLLHRQVRALTAENTKLWADKVKLQAENGDLRMDKIVLALNSKEP